MALFLTVAGFTGIFIAWFDELDALAAPELHITVPASALVAPLSPVLLRERVLAQYPGGIINYQPLEAEDNRSIRLRLDRIDQVSGKVAGYSPEWDEVFVDPYTGRIMGTRRWGDISQGAKNLMPFIYRLHFSLALGDWAELAFGVAALIWTLDSFVGFYLTFPVSVKRREGVKASGWLTRWKPSWAVRWGSSAYKVKFDLHRAGGLWIWPMLLVFAWSSVAFNVTEVYTPVMKLFGAEDFRTELPRLAVPEPRPAMDFGAALKRGEELARHEMAGRGLSAGAGYSLFYMPAQGAYLYAFTSPADFVTDGGRSRIAFSARDGRLLKVSLPSGQIGANTFTNWIMALHMGEVFGLPYRIAVSLIGAIVTMLSVTGIVIWMKKREGRVSRKHRLSAAPARLVQPGNY